MPPSIVVANATPATAESPAWPSPAGLSLSSDPGNRHLAAEADDVAPSVAINLSNLWAAVSAWALPMPAPPLAARQGATPSAWLSFLRAPPARQRSRSAIHAWRVRHARCRLSRDSFAVLHPAGAPVLEPAPPRSSSRTAWCSGAAVVTITNDGRWNFCLGCSRLSHTTPKRRPAMPRRHGGRSRPAP
jgi:hypothetical protein